MNRLKTILVGVDFSDGSRRALEQAVRLAQWNQAHLWIIHALDPDAMDFVGEEMPPALGELRRQHRERSVARLAEWAGQAGAPDGHSREVMSGAPLDVLLQESRSRGADLVVLGSKGRTNLKYVLLGSTVDRLLKEVPSSVLVVRRPLAI